MYLPKSEYQFNYSDTENVLWYPGTYHAVNLSTCLPQSRRLAACAQHGCHYTIQICAVVEIPSSNGLCALWYACRGLQHSLRTPTLGS